MLFEEFCGTAQVRGLTFTAVSELTKLDWFQAASVDELPIERGVYAWVNPATDIVHYHGSGSGASGLQGRLRGQLLWRVNQLKRINFAEASGDIDDWFRVMSESPAIRLTAESSMELWVAVADEPNWTLGTEEDAYRPSTALSWESFIYECSHLVTGRRSLLGGGAWESKPGTLGFVMERVAWSRLRQVSGM
ncbi:hypothetical protein [Rhodococcus sp. IEGM 1341]|jgi:hypothetical protein|uniref:hypothetical protein n=1 Tax=Rhodococcus sp. IEGM 1341 TaxID=3047090 RepID=UPI0024B81673|nr:hypothetical protein [Rhodococcus sp. IEGM 1341]MDI9928673.1 hypothetical protein [Rhodococcus sp. IEGM 1341]